METDDDVGHPETTRGERLRLARKQRFRSARAAAMAMGIPVSTYAAHERAEHAIV